MGNDWNERRATRWQLRTTVLEFERRPTIMGIVNVTPDSFSDGGHFQEPGAAIDRALQLAADGADILDIGGESTRPYSEPVPESEELKRVIPVIKGLASQTRTPISIDTSKATVARAAVDAGAEIINDVTGLEGDPQMVAVARQTGAAVCVMHMQGNPQTMQESPRYNDVVAEILVYLRSRREFLIESGIASERICLDPGIGFGKTHEHNLQLIQDCGQFLQLGCPVLVGHSRKGFIGKIIGDSNINRDIGTLAISMRLAQAGIQIIRVHNVAITAQALKVLAVI